MGFKGVFTSLTCFPYVLNNVLHFRQIMFFFIYLFHTFQEVFQIENNNKAVLMKRNKALMLEEIMSGDQITTNSKYTEVGPGVIELWLDEKAK